MTELKKKSFSSLQEYIDFARVFPKEQIFPLDERMTLNDFVALSELAKEPEMTKRFNEVYTTKPILSERDVAVILSYESIGQKIEERFHWSALALWNFLAKALLKAKNDMGVTQWEGWQREFPFKFEDLEPTFLQLLSTGSNMEAARWGCPELPETLVLLGMEDKLPLLSKAGFNFNGPFYFNQSLEYGMREKIGGNENGDLLMGVYTAFFRLFASNNSNSYAGNRSKEELEKGGRMIIEEALKQGVSLEGRDNAGLTALGFACFLKDDPLAQTLLDKGASPENIGIHPFRMAQRKEIVLERLKMMHEQKELEAAVFQPPTPVAEKIQRRKSSMAHSPGIAKKPGPQL